jgi:hypothetical protein
MPTTWNPTDNSDATLSNGNLTASFQTTNAWHAIRSTTFKTTGKCMFVCKASQVDSGGGWMVGVGDSSASLFTYLGATNDGAGGQADTVNSGFLTYGQAGQNPFLYSINVANGDDIGVCYDGTNSLIWWQDLTAASGWTNGTGGLNGNPAAGTGGITISAITAASNAYIMGAGKFNSGTADTLILNPTCAGYAGVIPAGFSAWDMAGAAVVTPTRTQLGVGTSLKLLVPYFVADRAVRNRVITRRNLWKPLKW